MRLSSLWLFYVISVEIPSLKDLARDFQLPILSSDGFECLFDTLIQNRNRFSENIFKYVGSVTPSGVSNPGALIYSRTTDMLSRYVVFSIHS